MISFAIDKFANTFARLLGSDDGYVPGTIIPLDTVKPLTKLQYPVIILENQRLPDFSITETYFNSMPSGTWFHACCKTDFIDWAGVYLANQNTNRTLGK